MLPDNQNIKIAVKLGKIAAVSGMEFEGGWLLF
jgi:hypothetical protein